MNKELLADLDEQDLLDVMRTASGRRVIWAFLAASNLTHNAMGPSVEQTAFNLGMQELGNKLMALFFTDRFLKVFRTMQDEALEAEKARLAKENDDV